MPTTTVAQVPLSEIFAGPNDRKVFKADDLEALAASIKANGLAQPITVRPLNGGFEIVAGERRFRAVTLLGWSTIDALVKDLDDETAADIMLAENVARADLNVIDEARAYQSRIDRFGRTPAEVGAAAGVSGHLVTCRLRLLKLVPEAQHLVSIGQLDQSVADRMASLDSNRQRLALAAINEGIDKAAFRSLADRLEGEQNVEPLFSDDAFLQIEEYVAEANATKKLSKPEQMRQVIRRLLATASDIPESVRVDAEALVVA